MTTALLLHGHQSSSQTWWNAADRLRTSGWQVTTPELPGHGGRTPPGEAVISMPSLSNEVTKQLSRFRFDVLVGHSLGALVGLDMVARELVTVGAIVIEEPPSSPRPERRLSRSASFRARVKRAQADPAREVERLQGQHPTWLPRDAAVVVDNRLRLDLRYCDRIVRELSWDLPDLITQVAQVPVLALLARDGRSTLSSTDRTSMVNHPHVRHRVLGTSHNIHRDDIDAWVAAVVEWERSCRTILGTERA